MTNRRYLFTSESVSMGHPDKVCDQISDAVLDSLIEKDPHVRAAIETLVTTGLVVVAGEVTVHNEEANAMLGRAEDTIRETIRRIGYDDPATGFDYRSCGVLRALHSQSPDISQGVTAGKGLFKEQGAGDQEAGAIEKFLGRQGAAIDLSPGARQGGQALGPQAPSPEQGGQDDRGQGRPQADSPADLDENSCCESRDIRQIHLSQPLVRFYWPTQKKNRGNTSSHRNQTDCLKFPLPVILEILVEQ